jgi:HK97 family phage prohead protease
VIRLTATQVTVDAATSDQPTRTITGLAVPWNVTAAVSSGQQVRFNNGSLPTSGRSPMLINGHDLSSIDNIVGVVTERVPTDDGMMFSAKIANTRAGDDALELLKLGALDAVSVGVEPTAWSFDDGVMVIDAADWVELSLVPVPAFTAARVTNVAASTPEPDETPEPEPLEEPEVTESTVAASTDTPAVIPTAPIWATAVKPPRLPSPGEYISMLRRGGSEWAQFNANLAATVQAATGDVLVSDAAGVVPVPIVAPVYNDVNPLRPIVNALGPRSMPDAGATFIRPYVKVHSSAGAQSTELTALSTADFEVDDIVVTKKTFGGKLILSEQVIDWSAPSMLDQAIADMAGQYALATEKYVVDQMADAITNTQEVVITSFTDEEELIRDLYLAAASIASNTNYLPNALVVGTTRWASLGGLTDSTGRPVFPQVGPMNAPGTLSGVSTFNGNPLGLQLVVSNQVGSQVIGDASGGGYTAKTANEYYWLLNTRGVEVYESYKGFIRDESVGTLGVTIAVRGYFAAHVVDVNMIRVLGPDATHT